MLSLSVSVDELLPDGRYGLAFDVSENFDKSLDDFEQDILFAINLMQENLGTVDVAAPTTERVYNTEVLDWELFPPTGIEAVISSLRAAGRIIHQDHEALARARLALFERFQPVNYLRGLGGNDTYVGAKYADDLVVFENMRRGNALYVLYEQWETQSQLPRSRLLQLSGDKIDRIVHRDGWETLFTHLLNRQLRKRGIRLTRR